MSEVEEALRGLRNELHAALPAPDVDRLTTRATARARTQTTVMAAVVAVAVAVPVLRLLPDATPPAAPPPPRAALAIDFADEKHGYALTSSCEESCTFTLLATSDGGRTWEPHRLPSPQVPDSGYFNASLSVVGPEHVVIDEPDLPNRRRILSTDGGHSWVPVLDYIDLDTPAPALTGTLGHRCPPVFRLDTCSQPGTIGLDGVTRLVPGVPQLAHTQIGQAPTSGGRYWFVGRDPETSAWTIGVSSGSGWAMTALAPNGIVAADGWSVVEADGTMIATATGADALLGVWHSADGGRSWVRTWQPIPRMAGLVGTPVLTSDGVLLVSDGKVIHQSTDLGHTFTRTDDPALGKVTWTRGGYLRVNGGQYALSTDGRHWRGFVVR